MAVIIKIPMLNGPVSIIGPASKREARRWLRTNEFSKSKTLGKGVCDGVWTLDQKYNGLRHKVRGGICINYIDRDKPVVVTEIPLLKTMSVCDGFGDPLK